MDIVVTTPNQKSQKTISVSEAVFGCPFNETLVHQAVTTHMARGRAGTRAQKSRSEVSGGGIKPWRQKGTGRARAGTIRSPLWRKGGVTFAAKPKDYSTIRFPKKMYRGAMRSIWSELLRINRLIVVEDFAATTTKTKDFIAQLAQYKVNNVLIITAEIDENLYYSSRNVPHVSISDIIGIDPVLLLKHDAVLITEPALRQVEERLQ